MKHARRKKPQSAASLGGVQCTHRVDGRANGGVAGAKRNRYRKRSKSQWDKNERKKKLAKALVGVDFVLLQL